MFMKYFLAIIIILTTFRNISATSTQNAKSLYCKIDQTLQYLNEAYNTGQNTPDDAVYDDLLKFKSSIYKTNKINNCNLKITNNVDFNHSQQSHYHFMGSLKKATKNIQVKQFFTKMTQENQDVVIQPKIDGIAIELVYTDGNLSAAITRGNGLQGKNILSLIKKAPNIPKTINTLKAQKTVILHGELFLKRQNLPINIINSRKERHKLSGLISKKNIDHVWLKSLAFFPWRWVNSENSNLWNDIKNLTDWNFPLIKQMTYKVKNFDDIISWHKYHEEKIYTLPMLTDGIVIKTTNTKKNNFKNNPKLPTLQDTIAWKFTPEFAVVTVDRIQINQTPTKQKNIILHFKPVKIQGIQIKKVSIGGLKSLQKKQIKEGDIISIALKGHAIPVFDRKLIES